jgi:hypothetical protein
MLKESGSLVNLSSEIEKDLRKRLQSVVDVRALANLSTCAACVLATRSANTGEWKAILPRESTAKSKENWIAHVLSSPLIDVGKIMNAFVPEVVNLLSKNGKTVVLMMDQSQIREDRQILMVSVRFGERALPILWEIVDTKGSIGFDVQEKLLNKVKGMLPPGVEILLSADRFYGTKNIVEWCQKAGWHYRVRLKGNLIFEHKGRAITAAEVGEMPNSCVIGARFNNSNISTNIGFLHERYC